MNSKTAAGILLCFLVSCVNQQAPATIAGQIEISDDKNENPYAAIADIPLPDGYIRIKTDSGSFAYWLRTVDLKKDKTVHQYNGMRKQNQSAQFAVLNISVGDKDLQQCADAVMRLRAEYLFAEKKFNEISFTDNNGKAYVFEPPYNRNNFHQYLNKVFGMCGTASLSKQLKNTEMAKLELGDVLIRGGFPGHAVIVMDVAKNKAGNKIYILAQSYMPAQDIHVLNNPSDKALSPWYEVNDENEIITPEYVFKRDELKRW